MQDLKKLLGKRIKEIRKAEGMTQDKLAEIIEVETPSISNIESGKYYPSNENLMKIANALRVKPYELYMFEHHKNGEDLKKELIEALNGDEELVKLIYKFYQALK